MPLKALEAILNGETIHLWDGGHLKRDWTYIDDTVNGVNSALHRPLGYQVINLGYGDALELLDFINIYEELTGKEFTFIKCGGENRIDQFREQWTDGANLFALAPGIVVGYGRNTKTFEALVSHGYKHMDQYEFVEEFENKDLDPERDRKIAISFEGHELCRGRGGARCMTMPVSRT